MNAYIITEDPDALLGMKLAGINGVCLQDQSAFEKAFSRAVNNPEIGIIMLTEKAYKSIEPMVLDFKQRTLFPLISVIPGREGYTDPKQKGIVSQMIKSSVGMS